MNRKDFLKRLSLGVAAVVVAPKLLIEESQYEVVEHPFIPMTGEPMDEMSWMVSVSGEPITASRMKQEFNSTGSLYYKPISKL